MFEEERRKTDNSETYYNGLFLARPVPVLPGTFECSADKDMMFVAGIGSGIAVCIHDMDVGIGAMAHILLPPEILRRFPDVPKTNARILADAEVLIDQMIGALKRHGAGRSRIKVRICGGTSIHEEILDSGLKNYILTKDMLVRRGLTVAGEDIAGGSCRWVHFFPSTGRFVRQPLRRREDIERLRGEEVIYLQNLPKLS